MIKVCFTLPDIQQGRLARNKELAKLTNLASELQRFGVQSIILQEIIDPEADNHAVVIKEIRGGLLWEFTRAERPEYNLYFDAYFDDILYKIIWEYGIDVVHSVFGSNRNPTSLVLTANLLGVKTIISSQDCAFICSKHTLIDSENVGCSGPSSIEQCSDCIACGKYSNYFTAKHRVILWNKYLAKVFKATSLLACPDEPILEVIKSMNILGKAQTARIDWPLAEESSPLMAQDYYNAYQAILDPNAKIEPQQSLAVVIPAFEGWLDALNSMNIVEHLDACLNSIYDQAVQLNSQVIIALEAKHQELINFCSTKYSKLNAKFLGFNGTPDLSSLLQSAAQLVNTDRVITLPIDRNYNKNFLGAHATVTADAAMGLTSWTHSKPLASLEEHVLSESINYRTVDEISELTIDVPWQAVSFPAQLLRQIVPNQHTLAQALGTQIKVKLCRKALSALNEEISLEKWLDIASKKSSLLGRVTLSNEAIEQEPELKQLSGSARGTLSAHRMLGLPTVEGLIAYGEFMHKLLHRINPGIWIARNDR